MVKIVTWNLNGFRSVHNKGGLNRIVLEHEPEFLFFQEVKCAEQDAEKFGHSTDYYQLFESSTIPGRHGVACYIKTDYMDDVIENQYIWEGPEEEGDVHPIDPNVEGSREARIQVVACLLPTCTVVFINVYSVNSRRDLSRLSARKDFDDHLNLLVERMRLKYGMDAKIFVVGDLNVVAEPIDYHGVLLPRQSGMTDQERDSFKKLLSHNGLVDTFRHANPDVKAFSWWSYMANARAKDLGWRIDYILASENALAGIHSVSILEDYYESDHAPILLEIDL